MAESRKGPQGFIVVLPGEIIEIPQDDDKSWLTLFYCLPKELVEKFPAALEIPRCPYEVLRTDKYDHIVKDDMMKILVWDSYSWAAWQFFQVKDRKGNYRDIPGSRPDYAGHSPIWQLSYAIIPYMRMKLEIHGLGFQTLYSYPEGQDFPWLSYGVEVSAITLLIAIISSAFLVIASPPIPGGVMSCYTVLFVQLGIPLEGLGVVMTLSVFLDFFCTAVNVCIIQLMLASQTRRLQD